MRKKITNSIYFSKERMEHSFWLRLFGPLLLEPQFWRFNRKSVGRGVFVGLYCAWIPIPIQVVISLVWAIFWRANLPLALGLVWLSNPFTMPALYYICYKVGAYFLHWPKDHITFQLSWHWITDMLVHIWKPLLLGSVICGLASGILGYVLIEIYWRFIKKAP